MTVSNKDSDYEKQFGLDMPLGKAVERFGQVTKEEVAADPSSQGEVVPDGEFGAVLFKDSEIRKIFHNGEWFFAVPDIVAALSGSLRGARYWTDLKYQLFKKEGFSDLSEKIGKLSFPGQDGKMYPTDVANTETVLRIVQSIPSPRAEPFKRWLARVGYERIQEIQDPEIAIRRAILTYQIQGRTDDWIDKRIRSIVVRKELTSEWKKRGIKEEKEFAILTNFILKETFEVAPDRHKEIKGIGRSHNLRDHMTDLELIFTMLGEKSTTDIAKAKNAKGWTQNRDAAVTGGRIAGGARKQLEKETGQKVVSSKNYLTNQREADPLLLTENGKSIKPRR